MQCTAGTDSMGTAWDKLRVPLAHLLYLFLDVLGCSLSITQPYGGPLLVLWWQGQVTAPLATLLQGKFVEWKSYKRAKK